MIPENLEAYVLAVPILSVLFESLIRPNGFIYRFFGNTATLDSFELISKSSLEGTLKSPELVA